MNLDTSQISEVLPHRERFPHTRLSAFTRRLSQRLLKVLSWIWLVLTLVVVVNVLMRYVLGDGRIEFEEIQWHLFAAGFLIGLAAYTPISQRQLGGIALRFETNAVIFWAILLMALGIGSSLISAKRVLSIDPIEATTGGANR